MLGEVKREECSPSPLQVCTDLSGPGQVVIDIPFMLLKLVLQGAEILSSVAASIVQACLAKPLYSEAGQPVHTIC